MTTGLTVDKGVKYSEQLHALAEQLDGEAAKANGRGLYGLADKLTEAAESSRSWADGLAEDGR